jgi:hypothetical protein
MTIQDPPTGDDRLMAAFRALVGVELARLKYAGFFQYGITGSHGEPPNVTLDCEPSDPGLGLPSLVKVPMQPGIDGITSKPESGIGCVVTFLNADPTRPVIVGVDSLGVNPVARLGDQVTMFLPQPTPIVITASIVGPFFGFASVANPITGQIVQGSGKVFTG